MFGSGFYNRFSVERTLLGKEGGSITEFAQAGEELSVQHRGMYSIVLVVRFFDGCGDVYQALGVGV